MHPHTAVSIVAVVTVAVVAVVIDAVVVIGAVVVLEKEVPIVLIPYFVLLCKVKLRMYTTTTTLPICNYKFMYHILGTH